MLNEEQISPNHSLRQKEAGFIDEREIYLSKLNSATLPSELIGLKHKVSWPVDMNDPQTHIATYFGDANYSSPSHPDPHMALDIQLPDSTPIVSPADAVVVKVDADRMNEVRGLADVLLYDKKSGLAYWLVHLDAASLPKRIAERHWFDRDSDVVVAEGEELGKVGVFFNEYTRKKGVGELTPQIKIPQDVEQTYGRSYNHLHFEVHYQPDPYRFGYDSRAFVNPLPLLERLY